MTNEENPLAQPSARKKGESPSDAPIDSAKQERITARNRRNGSLSKGPRTAAGRARSRWNSVTHGMLARTLLTSKNLQGKNSSDALLLHNELRECWNPQGIQEEMLVERIVCSHLRSVLCGQHESEMLSKPGCFFDQSSDRLNRYSAAANREYMQALHELQRLQSIRQGKDVAAPLAIDVTVTAGDEGVASTALPENALMTPTGEVLSAEDDEVAGAKAFDQTNPDSDMNSESEEEV